MKTEDIVATIRAIVASPLIDQYKFGLTKDSNRRRKQYIGVGFEYFAVIDTGLNAVNAIKKEQEVFELLTKKSDKNSHIYKKYHHKTREHSTTRSLGGRTPGPEDKFDL